MNEGLCYWASIRFSIFSAYCDAGTNGRFRKLPGRIFSQTLKRLATWRHLLASIVALSFRHVPIRRCCCICCNITLAKVAQPIQSGNPRGLSGCQGESLASGNLISWRLRRVDARKGASLAASESRFSYIRILQRLRKRLGNRE
jgi:hypothetical protein